MRSRPVLFGAPYSVYVRIVRLALEEKNVAYDLDPIDIFSKSELTDAYLSRHPFGRIPAFEHEGFRLYETGAIARYVDAAFPGIELQPLPPQRLARINQLVSIMDSYAYRVLVWDIYVERISKPKRGELADELRIKDALPKARTCLAAIAELSDGDTFLSGVSLTLADLYAAPMFHYFLKAPEAVELMAPYPRLSHWLQRMEERPSMVATEVD